MTDRILRVFPRCTSMTPIDARAFIGDPPLAICRPSPDHVDEVHVSVTFTWDIAEGERLAQAWANYYPVVKLGGPALDDCGKTLIAGQYVKHGVTITTRGCNRHCPWCLVPEREGPLRELDTFPDGHIVQDNNILQASPTHWRRVIQMLVNQRAVTFAGGLDPRLVSSQMVDDLKTLRIKQLFLSADHDAVLPALDRAMYCLRDLPRWKLRVYVMIGYDGETAGQAKERLMRVWGMGGLPFAQLYQPVGDRRVKYGPEWRDLARVWSRPAAMAAIHTTT